MQASTQLGPVVPVAPGRFLLAVVFIAAAALSWSLAQTASSSVSTTRWPTGTDFFAVSGWDVSAPTLESANGNTYITRQFQSVDGGKPLTFILTTSENAKTVYRAGADVPFLGSGYESIPVAADAVAEAHGRSVSLVRRGEEGWLQVYAYGERRGLLGNGPLGWGMAVFDTVVGHTNDYYLLRVMMPTRVASIQAVRRVSELADILFPRAADWYGSAG